MAQNKIDALTPAVELMAKQWDVVRPLLDGTAGMRDAGNKVLPRWPNEAEESYIARTNTGTLFPAFSRTIQTLTGKPFSKPVTIGDDVPAQIREWLQDCDLQGRNIDVFASNTMEGALAYGLAGVLVDCPVKAPQIVTQADEQAAGIRPYFVQVHAQQIVGWRSEYQPQGGGWQLTQLRLAEEVEVDDGDFGVKMIKQIRLLEPGSWSTWRQADSTSADWIRVAFGNTSLAYIPFVPVYGQRLGFMFAKPPLLELAYMNIKHWVSQSDQDTLLHVARVPILCATGDLPATFDLVVGGNTFVKLPIGGTLTYVEHTGKAIDAGRQSLEDLKEEMRQAGAELLVIGRRNEVTATQVATENELGTSALQRISQGLEDALDAAIQVMADYAHLGNAGHITLYNDFGVASLSDASSLLLVQMAQAGKISDETLFEEMQRRSVLLADRTWEEEQERIDAQGPPPGAIGLDANGNPLPQPAPGTVDQPPPIKPASGAGVA